MHEEMKQALVDLQKGIETADAQTIKLRLAFIDDALKSRRKEIDSQLKHYLKNRSYQKALMYLEGQPDIPKGRCGGRTDFS